MIGAAVPARSAGTGPRSRSMDWNRPMGNQLLAGLSTSDLALVQPHLEMMRLQIGRLPGAAGWPTGHVYFPHDAVIAVLAVTHAGEAIETAMIGCEGMVGAPSAAA